MTVSSEVLQDGYAGNLTTFRTLQLLCGFSNLEAANYCGVSRHTLRVFLANCSQSDLPFTTFSSIHSTKAGSARSLNVSHAIGMP